MEPGSGAHAVADALGYPVIVKASMGGGGRGMRVVHTADKLAEAIESAQREAGSAFGIPDVFLEKFVQKAKHIEERKHAYRKLIVRDWAYHLENQMRERYGFAGVPLVIDFVPRRRRA